jgi:5-methylcytosine-specific restriction endonuclease McrBC regulatory subunit McrC
MVNPAAGFAVTTDQLATDTPLARVVKLAASTLLATADLSRETRGSVHALVGPLDNVTPSHNPAADCDAAAGTPLLDWCRVILGSGTGSSPLPGAFLIDTAGAFERHVARVVRPLVAAADRPRSGGRE